jgi:uncharacterized RDD family membrane protein YckC
MLGADTHQLSGWWRRVASVLLDGVIVAVPLLAIGLITHAYSAHEGRNGRVLTHVTPAFTIIGLILSVGYLAATLCRTGGHNGQSLGSQALGIRVVCDDGQPYGPRTFVIRALLCKFLPGSLIGLLPALGLLLLLLVVLDDLWPLWDSENRALHDLIAKTHVVRTR